jgi:hypothetical protein
MSRFSYDTWRCRECGCENSLGDAACARCGDDVRARAEASPPPPLEAPGKAQAVKLYQDLQDGEPTLSTDEVWQFGFGPWVALGDLAGPPYNAGRDAVMRRPCPAVSPSEPSTSSSPNPSGEVVGNPTEGAEDELRRLKERAADWLQEIEALRGEVSRLREVEKRGREATDLLCRIYRNPENLLGNTMLRGDLAKFLGPDQLAFAKKNPNVGAGDDPEKGKGGQ